jgi:TrpR-related protein YerC/YecD
MDKKNTRKIEELFAAIAALKDTEETKKFLRDLLTEQELIEFGNRWKAARMLSEKFPYSIIEKETGLSSTTVARVSKWLNSGKGGYQLMIKRISNKNHHADPSYEKGLD